MAKKTALLAVDLQTAMFTEGEPPHCPSAWLGVVASLLERVRASRTPVIFVRHIHARFEPMRPGSPGFEIHAEADAEAALPV